MAIEGHGVSEDDGSLLPGPGSARYEPSLQPNGVSASELDVFIVKSVFFWSSDNWMSPREENLTSDEVGKCDGHCPYQNRRRYHYCEDQHLALTPYDPASPGGRARSGHEVNSLPLIRLAFLSCLASASLCS